MRSQGDEDFSRSLHETARGSRHESPRQGPRENPRGGLRESPREGPPESPRESPREGSRERPREGPREGTRGSPRERSSDQRECAHGDQRDNLRTYPPPDIHNLSSECPLCSRPHPLSSCETFKRKSYQERLELMFQKHICKNCHRPDHYAKGCAARRACERPGCQRKHHTLLHPPAETNGNQEGRSQPVSHQISATILNSATGAGRRRVCLRVVPVQVQGSRDGQIVETYALLDDGSDVSLCDRRLLDQLGLDGVQRRFTLTTLSSNDKEQSGLEVSLKASSLDGNESLSLPRVWSVDRIPVSDGSIPMPDDVKRWPHLRDLNPPLDRRT